MSPEEETEYRRLLYIAHQAKLRTENVWSEITGRKADWTAKTSIEDQIEMDILRGKQNMAWNELKRYEEFLGIKL